MKNLFWCVGRAPCLGLIAALILGAQSLRAQASGGDSDDSDDSDTSSTDATGISPDAVSVTDFSAPASIESLTTVDFATQQAIDAITNPWGGVSTPALPTDLEPGPGGNPVPAGAEEAGTFSPAAPTAPPEPGPGVPSTRRAQIHAVIVSNLSDPSQVLSGNVNLTGGIIALGPPTPSQKPGRWDPNVRITPDPDLLNGSKIPPLVPNVIDVRITHYEVTATIDSQGSVSPQGQ
jgi:hypothetical protein